MMMADVVDELSSCPVCFETYEEDGEHVPRIFPCHHTVCQECVDNLFKRMGISVICPECGKQHRAENGVKTFYQNKYILSHIRKEKARKMELRKEKEKAKRKAKQADMSKEL